jgi:hypothetical protein
VSTLTTIPAIVDGAHPDGTIVTVTGVATDCQGFPLATFLLTSETAVRVFVDQAARRQYMDVIGPRTASSPLHVTVTGRVVCPGRIPELVATDITRVAGGAR